MLRFAPVPITLFTYASKSERPSVASLNIACIITAPPADSAAAIPLTVKPSPKRCIALTAVPEPATLTEPAIPPYQALPLYIFTACIFLSISRVTVSSLALIVPLCLYSILFVPFSNSKLLASDVPVFIVMV